jgi:hypothetical protein
MNSRRRIPLVFLAVLTAPTAVFAVLALTEAPASANVTVQNGTTETFAYSPQFLLEQVVTTSTLRSGPALSATRLLTYNAPDHLTIYQTQPTTRTLKLHSSADVQQILGQYVAITAGSTPWVNHGSRFTRTESLQPFFHRVTGKPSLPGKVTETAIVRGGYLVYIHLLEITTGAGPQIRVSTETYAVLRIDGKDTSKL